MKFKDIKESIRQLSVSSSVTAEFMQVLSYLRNMVILGRNREMSAELLMEELVNITDVLKPAFQDMSHYIRMCDNKKAEDVLYTYAGTTFSKDLGRMLAGWDDIPQDDILKTIEIYSDNLKQENLAKRQKKDEMVSDLIYFPVVINSMVVLLDFVYVAFFIEQQDLLFQFF